MLCVGSPCPPTPPRSISYLPTLPSATDRARSRSDLPRPPDPAISPAQLLISKVYWIHAKQPSARPRRKSCPPSTNMAAQPAAGRSFSPHRGARPNQHQLNPPIDWPVPRSGLHTCRSTRTRSRPPPVLGVSWVGFGWSQACKGPGSSGPPTLGDANRSLAARSHSSQRSPATLGDKKKIELRVVGVEDSWWRSRSRLRVSHHP